MDQNRVVLANLPGRDLLVVAVPLVTLHADEVVDVVLVAPARALRAARRRARARRSPGAALPGGSRAPCSGARRAGSRTGSRRSAPLRGVRSSSAGREHGRCGEIRVAGSVDRPVLDPPRAGDPEHLRAVVVAVRDPDRRPRGAARGRPDLESLVRIDRRRRQCARRPSMSFSPPMKWYASSERPRPRGSDSSKRFVSPSQATCEVATVPREVRERLRHEGRDHPVLLREHVHHVAEEDRPVAARERIGVKFCSNWPFASSWSFA